MSKENVSHTLKILLADTYVLYLKTQNYHWNVKGPHFYTLHRFFEEQYEALAEAVDVIAERLRAIGEEAPASFKAYLDLTTLTEAQNKIEAFAMIKDLQASHEALGKTLRLVLESAEKQEDEATQDLITERMREHEKTIWMLQSHLM